VLITHHANVAETLFCLDAEWITMHHVFSTLTSLHPETENISNKSTAVVEKLKNEVPLAMVTADCGRSFTNDLKLPVRERLKFEKVYFTNYWFSIIG